MKNHKFVLFIIGGTLVITFGWYLIFCALGLYYTDKREVKNILNIRSLPESVINIKCGDQGFTTDLIEDCYFEINPIDFEKLTKGLDLKKEETDFQYLCENTGEKFDVVSKLVVYPKEYKYGGSITLLTNKDKSKVCIEHYEE